MPTDHLTAERRQQAEAALLKARESQTTFWSDLHALEEALGIGVSAEDDLAETTIDHLLTIRNTRPEVYR